jgi:hypothetical protein
MVITKNHDDKWTLNVATFEQKMERKLVMWKQDVQEEHLIMFKCVKIVKKNDRKVAKQGWKRNQLP